jgi:hypothetical protein
MIDYQLQMKAHDEMQPGERLLWSDQPDPARHLKRNLAVSLFSIPWTAFAVFWTIAAAGFKVPDFSNFGIHIIFPLFGIPFVLVGLGMLTSPYRAFRKARRTVYAITNRRAMIIHFGRSKLVQSYFERDLNDFSRTERADGSGDIVFRTEETDNRRGNRRSNPIGFFGVKDVRGVERILQEALKKEADETESSREITDRIFREKSSL